MYAHGYHRVSLLIFQPGSVISLCTDASEFGGHWRTPARSSLPNAMFDNQVWFTDHAQYHGTNSGWTGKRAYDNALVGANITLDNLTLAEWQAMDPTVNDVGSTYKNVLSARRRRRSSPPRASCCRCPQRPSSIYLALVLLASGNVQVGASEHEWSLGIEPSFSPPFRLAVFSLPTLRPQWQLESAAAALTSPCRSDAPHKSQAGRST